jgi:hypothetical protein
LSIKPRNDLDPHAVNWREQTPSYVGKEHVFVEVVSFLQSVQLYFSLLAGILSDIVKAYL